MQERFELVVPAYKTSVDENFRYGWPASFFIELHHQIGIVSDVDDLVIQAESFDRLRSFLAPRTPINRVDDNLGLIMSHGSCYHQGSPPD